MDNPTGKKCTRCGEHKPLDAFHRDRQKKDGLASHCRPCRGIVTKRYAETDAGRASRRKADRAFAQRHPDRVKKATAAWRAKNPDYSAEANRKWREANPGRNEAWYEANKERVAERGKAWREANAERKKATNRAWSDANRERRAASTRRWQAANPDKARELVLRRRARTKGSASGPVDVAQLWQRQCAMCPLCGVRVDDSIRYPDPMSKSLDHIFPLSRGGSHTQGNLQWTHLVCNLSKGASVPVC